MVEGIIARIRAELREPARVVATGGLAETPGRRHPVHRGRGPRVDPHRPAPDLGAQPHSTEPVTSHGAATPRRRITRPSRSSSSPGAAIRCSSPTPTGCSSASGARRGCRCASCCAGSPTPSTPTRISWGRQRKVGSLAYCAGEVDAAARALAAGPGPRPRRPGRSEALPSVSRRPCSAHRPRVAVAARPVPRAGGGDPHMVAGDRWRPAAGAAPAEGRGLAPRGAPGGDGPRGAPRPRVPRRPRAGAVRGTHAGRGSSPRSGGSPWPGASWTPTASPALPCSSSRRP